MLDYFTSAIAIDFEDMLWISKRPIDHSHWRHNLLQNVYIYLELIESEVDFESYDYWHLSIFKGETISPLFLYFVLTQNRFYLNSSTPTRPIVNPLGDQDSLW